MKMKKGGNLPLERCLITCYNSIYTSIKTQSIPYASAGGWIFLLNRGKDGMGWDAGGKRVLGGGWDGSLPDDSQTSPKHSQTLPSERGM